MSQLPTFAPPSRVPSDGYRNKQDAELAISYSSLSRLPDDVLGHHVLACFLRPWDARLDLVSRRFQRLTITYAPKVRLRPPKLPASLHLEVDVWTLDTPETSSSTVSGSTSPASSRPNSVTSELAPPSPQHARTLVPSPNAIGYVPPLVALPQDPIILPVNFSLSPTGSAPSSPSRTFTSPATTPALAPITQPVRKILSRAIWTLSQQLWDLPLMLTRFDWIPGYHCRNRQEWVVEREQKEDPRERIWILISKLAYRLDKKGDGKMSLARPHYFELKDADGRVVKGYLRTEECDGLVQAAKTAGKTLGRITSNSGGRF